VTPSYFFELAFFVCQEARKQPVAIATGESLLFTIWDCALTYWDELASLSTGLTLAGRLELNSERKMCIPSLEGSGSRLVTQSNKLQNASLGPITGRIMVATRHRFTSGPALEIRMSSRRRQAVLLQL
jgi:hypothetical protein